MSERIDHAAEAREWIDAATRHPGAVSTAILAQAEATLALVGWGGAVAGLVIDLEKDKTND